MSSIRYARSWVSVVAALAAGLTAASAGAQGRVVGEVASVAGMALAQAPGEEVRSLACGDPIYAGDLIVTGEDSSLGILSGDFWTGLGADTEMTFETTQAGAPRLDLAEGQIRVIDASAASPTPARVSAPGLVAPNAGRDTEALAFTEKVGTVAMICGWDDPLQVSAAGPAGGALGIQPGECAVAKPKEALYSAPASHAALPVSADAACAAEPYQVAGPHFVPQQVAAVAAPPPAYSAAVSPFQGPSYAPCQLAACAGLAPQGAAGARRPRTILQPRPQGP